jgi:hypothetical protein
MNEKPWVKTYAGGKPNYCTPVDNLNINDKRVHKIEKSVHEWVGLTDDEIVDLALSVGSYKGLVQAVEAKLKEKNNR